MSNSHHTIVISRYSSFLFKKDKSKEFPENFLLSFVDEGAWLAWISLPLLSSRSERIFFVLENNLVKSFWWIRFLNFFFFFFELKTKTNWLMQCKAADNRKRSMAAMIMCLSLSLRPICKIEIAQTCPRGSSYSCGQMKCHGINFRKIY